jgi:hypothetical protein
MYNIFGAIGNGDEVVHAQRTPVNVIEPTIADEDDEGQAPEKGIELEGASECFHGMAPGPFCSEDEAGRIMDEFMQCQLRQMAFHHLITGFLQGRGECRG